MRTSIRIAVALVVASVAAAPAAVASSSPPAPAMAAMAHDRAVVASGLLEARGSGNVVVQGRVALSANLPAHGVLRIVDRHGDASVHVSGREVHLRRGRGLVRRAGGIVFAFGSDVTLQFTGVGLEISAAGVGRVSMRGAGAYRLNLGRVVRWPRAAIDLEPATLGRGERPRGREAPEGRDRPRAREERRARDRRRARELRRARSVRAAAAARRR